MSEHDVGRRARTPLEEALATFPSVLEGLDRLVAEMALERERSSSAIASTRGVSNQMLWSGMSIVDASLLKTMDFVVPFAAIAVADVNSLGDVTVSTDAMGGNAGPGTAFIKKGRFACVPLVGRHLSISTTTAGLIFVAVYVDPQPVIFGSAT